MISAVERLFAVHAKLRPCERMKVTASFKANSGEAKRHCSCSTGATSYCDAAGRDGARNPQASGSAEMFSSVAFEANMPEPRGEGVAVPHAKQGSCVLTGKEKAANSSSPAVVRRHV